MNKGFVKVDKSNILANINSNGQYSLYLPPGEYDLQIYADGYHENKKVSQMDFSCSNNNP